MRYSHDERAKPLRVPPVRLARVPRSYVGQVIFDPRAQFLGVAISIVHCNDRNAARLHAVGALMIRKSSSVPKVVGHAALFARRPLADRAALQDESEGVQLTIPI